jgi:hypothetical protein
MNSYLSVSYHHFQYFPISNFSAGGGLQGETAAGIARLIGAAESSTGFRGRTPLGRHPRRKHSRYRWPQHDPGVCVGAFDVCRTRVQSFKYFAR